MKSEIQLIFENCKRENRPALLTYTVAGDSSKKQSLDILKSISKNVDILEVGVGGVFEKDYRKKYKL